MAGGSEASGGSRGSSGCQANIRPPLRMAYRFRGDWPHLRGDARLGPSRAIGPCICERDVFRRQKAGSRLGAVFLGMHAAHSRDAVNFFSANYV